MFDLSTATLDTFEPHVGTGFELDHPEVAETFRLARAEALTSYDHPLKKRDPFSLLFDGSRTDIQINQQIVPLKHEALGAIQLFMVPIARNEDGTIRYQSIFN